MKNALPIPQADALAKVRRVVEQIAAGATLAAAGRAADLDARHTGYHVAAALALGLLSRTPRALAVTPLGRTLLRSGQRSDDETATWRRAIEASPVLVAVAPGLLATRAPTRDALAGRIAKEGKLAASTAARRADTLLRWRKHVLELEAQPELPLTGASKRAAPMRYSGPAMIRALSIQSFKAFGEAKGRGRARGTGKPIELGPLTVLAGPNGAGKSTVLQALDVLGSLVRGSINEMLKAHEWDYGDLPHLRSAGKTIELGVEVALGAAVLAWTLTLGTRKHAGIEAETVRVRSRDSLAWKPLLERRGRQITLFSEADGREIASPLVTHPQSWLSTLEAKDDAADFPGLLALKAWAEGIHAFRSLDPSTLRAPSRGDTARVGPHGEGLATLLFQMKKSRPKNYARFTKRLKRYYPRLVAVEPRSAPYGWKYLDVTERWNGEKATFNVRQVSDGLLRMMVLASLPEWDTPPSVVLLDEVENGLHPRLIGGIAELLAEIATKTQVVLTTHSPITLNYVPADAARLVTRGSGGAVVVTPLTESKNFARLREHFEPGELWYNVGEETLLTPRRGR